MSEAALLICWILQGLALQHCARCGAQALLLPFLPWHAAGTECWMRLPGGGEHLAGLDAAARAAVLEEAGQWGVGSWACR